MLQLKQAIERERATRCRRWQYCCMEPKMIPLRMRENTSYTPPKETTQREVDSRNATPHTQKSPNFSPRMYTSVLPLLPPSFRSTAFCCLRAGSVHVVTEVNGSMLRSQNGATHMILKGECIPGPPDVETETEQYGVEDKDRNYSSSNTSLSREVVSGLSCR